MLEDAEVAEKNHKPSLRARCGFSLPSLRLKILVSALLRVVKDDAQREALPRAKRADPMFQVSSVEPARAANGTVTGGKDDGLTLLCGYDHDARLHARSLLYQCELTSRVVSLPLAQEKGELERKRDCTIEVLMQAVEITGLIFQDEWRGLVLTGGPTKLEKISVFLRKYLSSNFRNPAVRQGASLR